MKLRNGGAMGFLAMTFAVVGLTGLFASYAAPLPLARAMQREAAFDALLAPNLSAADRAALRDRLGDDAAALLDRDGDLAQRRDGDLAQRRDGDLAQRRDGDLAERVQAARVATRQRFEKEADAIGDRLRLLLAVVTAAAALFGIALLNVASPKAKAAAADKCVSTPPKLPSETKT